LEANYSDGNGKSFNNVKSALNTVFRCCLVEAGLDQSPFAPIINKRVTDVEHHRNLTLAEVDQIMAAPDLPLYVKIMTMLSRWTAQRLETCARMTPEMFDFDQKVFLIDPGKNKRFNEWVCCPILPDLENFIKPLIQQCKDPQLPIVQQFGYTSNNAFSLFFVKALRRLGINDSANEKASFHSLRGTAITWFKENGVTGDDLTSITGHDSQEVESIYARPIKNISQIAKSFYGNIM
jgi:integrase